MLDEKIGVGDAAANIVVLVPPHDEEVGQRQDGNRHACIRQAGWTSAWVRIRVAPWRMHSVRVRSALARTSSTVKLLVNAATCFIGLILRPVSGGVRSMMRDLSRWM